MKTLKKWLKRTSITFIVVSTLSCVFGAMYSAYATRRLYSENSAPGKMFDVGGHKLHAIVAGEGGPTVVLEAGVGAGGTYASVPQAEIATFTRVCSYDRAGLGWSELGPRPRTCFQNIKELRSLLEQAELPPPYVLVGHSYGGATVRLFASLYPEEVSGLVLIDPLNPESIPVEELAATPPGIFKFLDASRHFGILHLVPVPGSKKDEPEAGRAARKMNTAMQRVPRNFHSFCEELRGSSETFPEVVKSFKHLGDMPVTLIFPTRRDLPMKSFYDGRDGLKRISNNITIVEPDCGHLIEFEKPGVVVEAVRNMLELFRDAPESSP